MMLPAKDIQIIKHILRYCEEIDIAVKRFGDVKNFCIDFLDQ